MSVRDEMRDIQSKFESFVSDRYIIQRNGFLQLCPDSINDCFILTLFLFTQLSDKTVGTNLRYVNLNQRRQISTFWDAVVPLPIYVFLMTIQNSIQNSSYWQETLLTRTLLTCVTLLTCERSSVPQEEFCFIGSSVNRNFHQNILTEEQ